MKFTILMGSPRKNGNTAVLSEEFTGECARMGVETETVWLYDKQLRPCLGCMTCQSVPNVPGCPQKDDFAQVFAAVDSADVVVLATPIYTFFCTAPMKVFLDRAIYAGKKNYGGLGGQALLKGKRLAALTTCGYPAEKGADLWEEGLKRFCRHGELEYMGMFCCRDRGAHIPFMDQARAQGVRDFAQAIRLAVKMEEL